MTYYYQDPGLFFREITKMMPYILDSELNALLVLHNTFDILVQSSLRTHLC